MSYSDIEQMTWDMEFEADGTAPEFKVLPKGTYSFIVENVERTFVKKEDSKYKDCPMADVTFRITGKAEDGEEIEITRHENFMLHSNFLWKISQLFISVGLVKQGEKFKPDWAALVTRGGQCEVSVREYTKKDGTKGKSNQIDRYCDPATTVPAWKRGF